MTAKEREDDASRLGERAPALPQAHARTLKERCEAIELLLLDVDGVLTDGSIVYTDNQVEVKRFHVRDGAGLKIWQRCGKKAAILSGRTSAAVEIRAAELDIAPVLQGIFDKLSSYRQLLANLRVEAEQVCCIADDVTDLSLLENCGLAVAVADACPEARRLAHYVTRTPGGHGAVREVIELILRCQGGWQKFLSEASDQKSGARGQKSETSDP